MSTATQQVQGIVLLGHGSRDPLWHLSMKAVAELIRARSPQAVVDCAYLELSPPDLPTCVAQLLAQGAQKIRVLPIFFGLGKHAREEVPPLVETLQQTYQTVLFELLPAIGENPDVLRLLADIALAKPVTDGKIVSPPQDMPHESPSI